MGDGPLTRPGASGLMRSLAIDSTDTEVAMDLATAERGDFGRQGESATAARTMRGSACRASPTAGVPGLIGAWWRFAGCACCPLGGDRLTQSRL